MTDQQERFYKLVTIDFVRQIMAVARDTMHRELLEKSTDATLFKRRCRMLSQIAQYEAQIYRKIYRFRAHTRQDYLDVVKVVQHEVACVIKRDS